MSELWHPLTAYSHPVVQVVSLLLMIYVMYLGKNRILSLHYGMRRAFAWKRHVQLGTWSMAIMFLAGLGGICVVKFLWRVNTASAVHTWTGIAIMALIVIGYVSGLVLDKKIPHTPLFTAFHGVVNLILIALSFWALYTGIKIIGYL